MDNTYKNIHSHIFTMDNAPKKFLHLFLPALAADAVDIATNTQAGANIVATLIKLFGDQGRRYARFLKIGKSKDQLTVFEELMEQYPDKSIELVALTLNMNHIGAGETGSGFEGQVQQVIDIKKQYPNRILPFLGLDPRWKSTGREIRMAVEQYFETKIESGGELIYPFAGLKIYPSTGYYVFDERFKETFEWAADNGVPIIAHTYYLGGIFNNDRHAIEQTLNPMHPYTNVIYDKPKFKSDKNFWRWVKGSNNTTNCKNSCSYFLEPFTYEEVFKFFETKNKKLKICLAHFGGVKQMKAEKEGTSDKEQKKPYGVLEANWFVQIQNLLKNFEGAYTDISYDVAEGAAEKGSTPFVFKTVLEETEKEYGNKILYGTDYFMAEQESNEKNTYDKFRTFANDKKLKNGNTLWDQIAKNNCNEFLKSKYYP